MNIQLTENERAALALLRSSGAPVLEAAQVACAALKAGRGRMKRAMKCLAAGAEALRQQERTVSFEQAVAAALEARRDRRTRTVYDFRYFTRRFMKRCARLARRRVRSITPQECAGYIEQAFNTPRQRQKARLILSGVFSTAVKKGWCDANPVARVETPRVEEKPVSVLTPQEIDAITTTAENYQNGSCAAAVGLMLYAGIRPHEVSRLTWDLVDLQERAIYIMPQHSKTGGARRVSILAPLLKLLQRHQQGTEQKICPANWQQHWRKLRQAAGWNIPAHPWRPDVLRHTFASYHLNYFRSYAELQCELGHRDSSLLRTRYVNQQGVVNARTFWQEPFLTSTLSTQNSDAHPTGSPA